MRKKIVWLVSLLMAGNLTSNALATEYLIPEGLPVVDGNLSEWTNAKWIAMDQVYYGNPIDLTGAKWAARWNAQTNLIYVAVTGVDTQHFLSSQIVPWNVVDQIEICLDAGNSNDTAYSYNDGYWKNAQEYCGGTGGYAGSEWFAVAGQPAYEAIESGIISAFKAKVSGDVFAYEVAIKPYHEFNLADPESSTQVVLTPGRVLGLDVLINSKSTTNFGMYCENMMVGKWQNAAQFRDYTLVIPGDATMDGKVNVGDLAILAANYGRGNVNWSMGDFNGDGKIDVGDLGILAGRYGYGTSSTASIPESATLLVFLGGSLLAGLSRKG
jgi:hypothetical protein